MIPVILSGGSGTRLWPVSRKQLPKPFCHLMDETLIDQSLQRLASLGVPWVLTVAELEVLTARALAKQNFPREHILLEPEGRNTAPALALLCQLLKLRGLEKEIVGIFPADHLIGDEDEFGRAVALAASCAEQGYVATLGIRPSRPETGFGYIEVLDEVIERASDLQAHTVQGFHEKPNEAKAAEYLRTGRFFWNAGIFVFRVQTMIANFINHAPQIWQPLSELREDLSNLKAIYQRLPSISIDYAVMEKLQAQVCVPCDVQWSDLGSWDDLAGLPPQALQRANHAIVAPVNAPGCFVFSEASKAIGLVGTKDLIVVDTPDALLIAAKGQSQNVRELMAQLKEKSPKSLEQTRGEIRPWGQFTVLCDEPHYKVKWISVDPHSQLSYQSHTQRREQWTIVKGEGEVTLDGQVHTLKGGDTIAIPVGSKHRMRNSGSSPLEFVEVQTGSYFGEDDIVRYQDDYNRA